MFTLTSTVTKFAVLTLSAGMAFTAADVVTRGFQTPVQAVQTVVLPTVFIVGYRSSLVPDTLQAAATATKANKS